MSFAQPSRRNTQTDFLRRSLIVEDVLHNVGMSLFVCFSSENFSEALTLASALPWVDTRSNAARVSSLLQPKQLPYALLSCFFSG
jgi:hypothetical protein